jgi:hypothetical protein
MLAALAFRFLESIICTSNFGRAIIVLLIGTKVGRLFCIVFPKTQKDSSGFGNFAVFCANKVIFRLSAPESFAVFGRSHAGSSNKLSVKCATAWNPDLLCDLGEREFFPVGYQYLRFGDAPRANP